MNNFFKALTVLLVFYCPNLSAQDSTTSRIDRLLASQFKPDEPGATVLVAKGGQVIYQRSFGMAQLELRVPSDTSMVYYIGSNTKQFTAIAILQLMEKGLLSLEDTLGKYVSCKAPISQITIRQLLSHTSGLNGNGYADSSNIPAGKTRQADVERFAAKNQELAAGSQWKYNNANFQTLGYIIEKVSGKTYQDYITENIFKPSGMNSSFVATGDESIIKGRPGGYGILRRGIVNMYVRDIYDLFASGGILATALDMYRWNEALKAGKLVSKKTWQLALTPQTLNDGRFTFYGFGWYIDSLKGSVLYRHGGAVPGFISETMYLPAEDIYIVFLLNAESAVMPQALARIIAADLAGKPYKFEESAITQKELSQYVGVYESDKKELVNITETGGKLYWQRLGGRKYEIRRSAPDQFYFEKDFLWIDFGRNSRKKVDRLSFGRVGIWPSPWAKTDKPLMQLSETGQQL